VDAPNLKSALVVAITTSKENEWINDDKIKAKSV
jgi:hypothetical protein